jgi:hypothetical protein
MHVIVSFCITKNRIHVALVHELGFGEDETSVLQSEHKLRVLLLYATDRSE